MNELIDFFMDPLRLTLIIAGVAVLLAIILFSRKSSKRREFTYNPPSSKEFSFGEQSSSRFNDDVAPEVLVDEEVIVIPPKQKESEIANNTANGYNIRTQPTRDDQARSEVARSDREKAKSVKSESIIMDSSDTAVTKSAVNEFRAFQSSSADEQMGSDVFEDDIIATPKQPSAQSSKFETPANTPDSEVRETAFESIPQKTAVEEPEPAPVEPTPVKERFIVLHVIAAEGKPFNGVDIVEATKTLGLAYGKHAIFHYPMSAAPAGDSKFCLVNMSPEGNFETNNITTLETNGVSFIMRLPIRGSDPSTVFSNMLGVTQSLARKLGGEILDQTRVPLTPEIISTIRADITQFEDSMRRSAPVREPVPEI